MKHAIALRIIRAPHECCVIAEGVEVPDDIDAKRVITAAYAETLHDAMHQVLASIEKTTLAVEAEMRRKETN